MHCALINHFLAVLDIDAVSGVHHLAAHEVVDGVVAILLIVTNAADGSVDVLISPSLVGWHEIKRSIGCKGESLVQGEHG